MTEEEKAFQLELEAEEREALKNELIKKANALGIKANRSWGVETIEAAIADKAVADETPEGATEEVVAEGVLCRVTKVGHGKISTGKEEPSNFSWKDEITLPLEIAQALEARAFVEIEEDV